MHNSLKILAGLIISMMLLTSGLFVAFTDDSVGLDQTEIPPHTKIIENPSFTAQTRAFILRLAGIALYTVYDADELTPEFLRDMAKNAPPPDLSGRALERKEITLGGRRAVHYVPQSPRDDAVLFHIHGGAYVSGSPDVAAQLVSNLVETTNLPAFGPTYRLAPEHPYPAAPEDILNAYREFLDLHPNKKIVLAGSSAGGGLATGLLVNARNEGLRLPDCVLLNSPHVDLTFTSDSVKNRSHRDLLRPAQAPAIANAYAGKTSPYSPGVSPLFADLHGLPPILIQVGTEEVMFSDSISLHKNLLAAAVSSELEIWRGMWHVWPNQAQGAFPEVDAAIESAAAFINKHLTD